MLISVYLHQCVIFKVRHLRLAAIHKAQAGCSNLSNMTAYTLTPILMKKAKLVRWPWRDCSNVICCWLYTCISINIWFVLILFLFRCLPDPAKKAAQCTYKWRVIIWPRWRWSGSGMGRRQEKRVSTEEQLEHWPNQIRSLKSATVVSWCVCDFYMKLSTVHWELSGRLFVSVSVLKLSWQL